MEVRLKILGLKKFEPIKTWLDLGVNSFSTSRSKNLMACTLLVTCEHDSTTEMNAHDDA